MKTSFKTIIIVGILFFVTFVIGSSFACAGGTSNLYYPFPIFLIKSSCGRLLGFNWWGIISNLMLWVIIIELFHRFFDMKSKK